MGTGSIGGKDNMSGTFEKLNVPHTLVSFAVTTDTAKNIRSGSFQKAGNGIYLVSVPYSQALAPDFETFKQNSEVLYKLNASGKISAMYPVTAGGIAEAVSKMAMGNRIGAAIRMIPESATAAELGLEVSEERPLFAVVSRLTDQKGMDLITYNLPWIAESGAQLVVLGTGEERYAEAFRYFEQCYPGSFAARIEFSERLSRRIYAGADAFLMPSQFEPCGLSQIIAMRYGTLPIVRETGGLKDTVKPYNKYTGEGTGFSFANFNAHELRGAISEALELYQDKTAWNALKKQAMEADFSWNASAAVYMDMYRQLTGKY
jgi:glycosyltransferase involved in cell wall biosynthesis